MGDLQFKAKKVSRTATIICNVNIEKVFPLFGAFEERKWAEGWEPNLIYPAEEIIEEGTTFKTDGNDEESEYLWRVVKFYPKKYLIQYLVSTENRYWTITAQCNKLEKENKTLVTITYTFIGLNEKGNRLNAQHIERMYKNNLKDWEEEINKYLEKN
jgi:hypothetical protein